MQRQPDLTDRTALERNRRRAERMAEPALFLQEVAASELQDRLSLVNRAFTAPAVVTGWPSVWAERMPDARIVADTDVLELEPGAHDVVVHALCLHWANDPVGQLIQCRRALRPDGLFLAALFGGQTLVELRAALAEAEVAVTGGLSPRIAPMGEIRDLGGLLQRAGFALPVADGMAHEVTYRSASHLMRDLRAMGEGNALAARHRHPAPRALFQKTDEIYRAAHAAPAGRIPATFEILYLTGWAPAETQPQPLRPGSATTRLADVLGVDETSLPGTSRRDPD